MYKFLQTLLGLFLSKGPFGAFAFSLMFLILGHLFTLIGKDSPFYIFFHNVCIEFSLISFLCGIWITFR